MQEIGLYGVQASANIDYQAARIYYKQLYAIEHGFRDLKSDLQIRPTFHWKPEHISPSAIWRLPPSAACGMSPPPTKAGTHHRVDHRNAAVH